MKLSNYLELVIIALYYLVPKVHLCLDLKQAIFSLCEVGRFVAKVCWLSEAKIFKIRTEYFKEVKC